MVRLIGLTSSGRSAEDREQIVRHHLFCSSNYSPFTSDCLEQILGQLSKAVLSAVNIDQDQSGFILHALRDLTQLEIRPTCLTRFAYGWCSAIYEYRQNFEDWEGLLLVCLEVGFRHLDPEQQYSDFSYIHTEHHQGLVDVAFKSQKSEAIADLIHAWTPQAHFCGPADTLIEICADHLVGLDNLVPFSPRLRRLVIRFIDKVGHKGFKGAEVEKLIELLDHLHITVGDMDVGVGWMSILLGVIQSPKGAQRLSHWYWELLVEIIVPLPWCLGSKVTHGLSVAESLVEAQEWDKLECWIGVVWMSLPGAEGWAEEDLENPMVLLFHRQPGAAQKLGKWIERSLQNWNTDILGRFERTCKRAHEEAQRQVAL